MLDPAICGGRLLNQRLYIHCIFLISQVHTFFTNEYFAIVKMYKKIVKLYRILKYTFSVYTLFIDLYTFFKEQVISKSQPFWFTFSPYQINFYLSSFLCYNNL